jgi:hypothetical protein
MAGPFCGGDAPRDVRKGAAAAALFRFLGIPPHPGQRRASSYVKTSGACSSSSSIEKERLPKRGRWTSRSIECCGIEQQARLQSLLRFKDWLVRQYVSPRWAGTAWECGRKEVLEPTPFHLAVKSSPPWFHLPACPSIPLRCEPCWPADSIGSTRRIETGLRLGSLSTNQVFTARIDPLPATCRPLSET